MLLSEDHEPGLSGQIEKALAFLLKHEKELDRLKNFGADDMLLDFGIEVGRQIQQAEYPAA